jgi:hypothetical protein
MSAEPANALEELETIAEQGSLQINQGALIHNIRSHSFAFQLSPSIERARASRENEAVIAEPSQKKREPVVEAIAIREPVTPCEVVDYDSLIGLLRNRADELEISRETLNAIAGLPDGLAAKILGLKRIRRIGMLTLGPLLDALGLRLIAVPDEAALERNRALYVKRDDAHYRSAKARHSRSPAVRCGSPILE